METGKMDRRITLQSYSTTIGSEGSVVKTWTDVATVWAAATQKLGGNPGRGSETIEHQKVNANASFVFPIRYTTEFTPTRSMRVVYNSTNLNINDIIEIPRRRGWEIHARVDAV